jgi:hypothetical protein
LGKKSAASKLGQRSRASLRTRWGTAGVVSKTNAIRDGR